MDCNDEKWKLNLIANDSIYGKGMSEITTRYCGTIFRRYMKKGSVLELGPADGVMTDLLYPLYSEDYTIVDAGKKFVKDIQKRFPNIQGAVSLFEEYAPDRKFDNIILGHVLEHVNNPTEILKLCKGWLNKKGMIFAAVPNKNSLHRQAAVEMGLLSRVDMLNEKDIRHGHRRVFDNDMLKKCFQDIDLDICVEGGYWLKPLSDRQIEESWTKVMIEAFLKLGEKYPKIAGEIYIIARE